MRKCLVVVEDNNEGSARSLYSGRMPCIIRIIPELVTQLPYRHEETSMLAFVVIVAFEAGSWDFRILHSYE